MADWSAAYRRQSLGAGVAIGGLGFATFSGAMAAGRLLGDGGPDDQGFAKEQVHAVVEQYGDVAQVSSTYEKRCWDSDEVLSRGINSFQLVRHDGQWWIVGLAWDEEADAEPPRWRRVSAERSSPAACPPPTTSTRRRYRTTVSRRTATSSPAVTRTT